MNTNDKILKILFWGTLTATAVMAFSSISHLAAALAAFENKENRWISWLLAGGIEFFMVLSSVGLLFLLPAMAKEKNKDRKAFLQSSINWMNTSIYFFTFINLFGNVSYTLMNFAGTKGQALTIKNLYSLDPLQVVSLFVFSFSVPFIVLLGSKLIIIFSSDFDADEAKQINKSIEKKVPELENRVSALSTNVNTINETLKEWLEPSTGLKDA